MAKLTYSDDALNVLHKFHRVDAMFYVEGDDDVLFWSVITSKFSATNYRIESVGGCQEIDKLIDRISANEVNAFVGRDSDYLEITGGKVFHNRIHYTYGYSIENSILTPNVIFRVVKNYLKSADYSEADVNAWYQATLKGLEDLIKYEVATRVITDGDSIMGKSYIKFCDSGSGKVSLKKVVQHTRKVKESLNAKQNKNLIELLKKQRCSGPDLLNGHFLMSMVVRLINDLAKSIKKKVNISYDGLYAAAMATFENIFTPEHPHYKYYELQCSP